MGYDISVNWRSLAVKSFLRLFAAIPLRQVGVYVAARSVSHAAPVGRICGFVECSWFTSMRGGGAIIVISFGRLCADGPPQRSRPCPKLNSTCPVAFSPRHSCQLPPSPGTFSPMSSRPIWRFGCANSSARCSACVVRPTSYSAYQLYSVS
jgi:hypothetical protein